MPQLGIFRKIRAFSDESSEGRWAADTDTETYATRSEMWDVFANVCSPIGPDLTETLLREGLCEAGHIVSIVLKPRAGVNFMLLRHTLYGPALKITS